MEVINMKEIEQRLTPESFNDFEDFMKGQTVGMDEKGNSLIYAHDFLRFWHSWEWL